MAEKKEAGKTEVGEAGGAKSKKKLFIIIGVALALLLGGGAGAFVMLGKKKDAEQAAADSESADEAAGDEKAAAKDKPDGEHKAKADKKKKKKGKGEKKEKEGEAKPIFVEAEPFTVNLSDPEQKMAQLKLTLVVENDKMAEEVKTMMPAVRNNILLLLGSKSSADLGSREAKEKLALEMVDTSNKALENGTAEDAVKGVLFQQMIIQ